VPVVVHPPVVYRPGGAVVYRTAYYGRGGHKGHHHDEYGTYYRDGNWQPVPPADPRRRPHEQNR